LKFVRSLPTAVLAGTGVLSLAAPAFATFYGNTTDYGYVSSSSTCSVPGSPGYCSIRYTNNGAVSRPPTTGGVKYCGAYGIPDGTYISEAIASGRLNDHNVGVIWGGTGAVGALNCH